MKPIDAYYFYLSLKKLDNVPVDIQVDVIFEIGKLIVEMGLAQKCILTCMGINPIQRGYCADEVKFLCFDLGEFGRKCLPWGAPLSQYIFVVDRDNEIKFV